MSQFTIKLGINTRLVVALAAAAMVGTPLGAQSYEHGHTAQNFSWNGDTFWRDAPRDVGQRITYMQRRIDRGIQDGSLTRKEGQRLQRDLNQIRRDARRGRGGSQREARIQGRLDDLGRSIRWERQDGQFATDYDASRYYRPNERYAEQRLSDKDYVYRGSDGRYYCKRSDGTIGLIVGGITGGVLGNVIDGGRERTAGTLIGGALGALAGSAIQRDTNVSCR